MADDSEYRFADSLQQGLGKSDREGLVRRRKQSKWNAQDYDAEVIMSAEEGSKIFTVECKSVKTSSTNKLYFSQHFTQGYEQVRHHLELAEKINAEPFLALEIKRGRGRSRKAVLMRLEEMKKIHEEGEPGIPIDLEEMEEYVEFVELDDTGNPYEIKMEYFLQEL